MKLRLHKIPMILSAVMAAAASSCTVLEDGEFMTRSKASAALNAAIDNDKYYTNPTLVEDIEPVVRYYSRYGNETHRMQAWYYLGRAQFGQEDYNEAMLSYMRAQEFCEKTGDSRYSGLINLAFADTYSRLYNTEDEFEYILHAVRDFEAAQDETLLSTALCRASMALTSLKRYDEAMSLMKYVLKSPYTDVYTGFTAKVQLACLLMERGEEDYPLAVELFEDVLAHSPVGLNFSQYYAYAYALTRTGSETEGRALMNELFTVSPDSRGEYLPWKILMEEKDGDFKGAYRDLQTYLAYQDSVSTEAVGESLQKTQSAYLQEKAAAVEARQRGRALIFAVISLLLVLVVLAVVAAFRYRLKKQEEERNMLADLADSLKVQLKQAEAEQAQEREGVEQKLSSLRSEYARMYKAQFKRLGELAETVLVAGSRRDSQKFVYEKVQEMVGGISGDRSGQNQFEKAINRDLDGIMEHFRAEFPQYGEDDYRFVSYAFVGFDATTILLIMKMPSQASVYMRKSRIKKAIISSEAPHKERFLEMLG